jgi:hypothetical protein
VATKTKPASPGPPVDNIHAIARENAKRQQAEAEGNGVAPEPEVVKEPEREQEALLELSTALEPRATVKIDGTHYELRHRREFSIIEQHALQVEGDEFDALWERKEQLNSKQRQRLKTVLDSMFDKVIMAPTEVKDKIDDESRRSVVLTFTRAPLLLAQLRGEIPNLEDEESPISDT